jgi:hypothetical protein
LRRESFEYAAFFPNAEASRASPLGPIVGGQLRRQNGENEEQHEQPRERIAVAAPWIEPRRTERPARSADHGLIDSRHLFQNP